MASSPSFASTPVLGAANLSAALGGSRTTPTGTSTLITAAAGGNIVTRAVIQLIGSAGVASSGNVVAFYLYDGATYYLFREVQMPAVTPSATAAATPIEVPFADFAIPSGWVLAVGIRTRAGAQDDTAVTAFGPAI